MCIATKCIFKTLVYKILLLKQVSWKRLKVNQRFQTTHGANVGKLACVSQSNLPATVVISKQKDPMFQTLLRIASGKSATVINVNVLCESGKLDRGIATGKGEGGQY